MSSFTIKEIFPLLDNYCFLGDENGMLNSVANFEQDGDWSQCVMWLADTALEKNQKAVHSGIGLLMLTEKSYEYTKRKTPKRNIGRITKRNFQQILSAFFEKKWTPIGRKNGQRFMPM
jgi:hypothetical protein